MAELQRVTKEELIVNILAMYYNTSVAEVLRILEEEQKQKELAPHKAEVTDSPPE